MHLTQFTTCFCLMNGIKTERTKREGRRRQRKKEGE
jgi:hypothetical protein